MHSPTRASNVWENEIHGCFLDVEVKYHPGNPIRLPSIRGWDVTLKTSMSKLLYHLLSIPDWPEAMLHILLPDAISAQRQ